jgi:hypothetical protein
VIPGFHGLHCLVIAFALVVLAGCPIAGAQSVGVVTEPLAMVATWTVPSRNIRVGSEFHLQVRIAPVMPLEQATVEVEVPAGIFALSGARRYALGSIAPSPPPPASHPPDPPALGMTEVRNFALVPLHTGTFDLRVILESEGRKQIAVQRIEVMSKI